MGKRIITSGLLLAAVFGGFMIGCKKKHQTVSSPSSGPAIQAGAPDLRVLGVSPKGPVSASGEAENIVVIFDKPMVALEALPEGEGPAVLRIDPPTGGKTRWLGSKTLAFTPERRLPFATEVKVTVPAGTRALDGSYLKDDYSWSFQTLRPRLVQHFPVDKQQWLKPDTEVLLVFNQPVDKGKAAPFVSLIAADGAGPEKARDFRLSRPAAERLKEEKLEIAPENALLLEPRPKLEPERSYTVVLKSGLPSNEGPLGLEKAQAFAFETYRNFRFEGLEKTEGLEPDDQLQFKFSNPVAYKTLAQHVHFEPSLAVPEYYSDWEQTAESLWLSLPLQPETSYSGWIDADLSDEFGNRIGQKTPFTVATGSYSPSVNLTTGYGILEAYAQPRYPVSVLNPDPVFLQAARVGPDQLVPLLNSPKLFSEKDKYEGPAGFFSAGHEIKFKAPRNRRVVVPLEIAPYLRDKYGWVFLQLDRGPSGDEWSRYPKVLVQVTNLGITGKYSPENDLVWVTELKTGQPVADAAVEIRDDQNRVKWTGRTGRDGKASAPGWRVLGMTTHDEWSEPRQWVFVRRGDDSAFSLSGWGTGIDPYRFGISFEWSPRPSGVQGSVFTDRGIYRAGETVHIKVIARRSEGGRWTVPAPAELACEIRDAFNKSVYKGKAVLDDYGSLAFDFDSSGDAALGYYGITVKVPPAGPGEKETALNGSFRIEAFRPAEFEVLLRTQDPSYVFGQTYDGEIGASYLFGGAMSGQPVSWHLRLDRTHFSPPGFKGYTFGNELEWGEEETENESRLVGSGEGTLDPQGKTAVKLPLRADKEKDSVLATLEATVTSPSRRSISNRIATIVHRGEFYIGLKPQTSFLEKGRKLGVDVVAANPQGAFQAGQKVQVKLVRREWRSVKKAGVGGRLNWLTEKEDTEISRQDVQTGSEPASVTFTPEKAGFYFLLASAADGKGNAVSTATSFYVTGNDYVPWERRDDDSVELVADADSYRPGGQARILVKSPYEKARALVTVERDLVLDSRVVEIAGTSSEIAVPIRPEYAPNAFVSVILIEGRAASAKPSFKIGYVNLNVDPGDKRLAVEVAGDKKEYRPKESVTLTIKVKDAAGQGRRSAVTLAVADAGVLNLIGYETPDPFAEFYGPRSLSVKTSESLIHVIGQREYGEKGGEPGGGGEENAPEPFPGLAEVELRGDFRATPYWNPSLMTDDSGEARVTFALPDNLTTFRIFAVAQTLASDFGRGESSFRVSKKLMLQAALPRFVRAGDVFAGGVVVHNLSDERGTVRLSAQVKGVRPKDALERDLELGAGESKETRFAFESSEPGTATFDFRAVMGGISDGLETEIPVELPRATETVAAFGETRDRAVEKISVPEHVFADQGGLDVQASPSALLGLRGTVEALTDYPYLCLEQRLSALLPFIVAEPVIIDFGLTPWDRGRIRRYVETGLRELWSYQKDSGGLGLWPDSEDESPFLTCYAALALVRASRAGIAIDEGGRDRTLQYLHTFLGQPRPSGKLRWTTRDWKTTRAFALYVLALAGKPEPGYYEKLFAERDELSLFGRALLLKALYLGKGSADARGALVEELLNKIKVTPETAHFEEDPTAGGARIYASNVRTTALILQTFIETGVDHPLLPAMARWLVQKLGSGPTPTTQEDFYAFYALNDYYLKAEGAPADFQAKISLAGKPLIEAALRTADRQPKAAHVRLSDLGDGGRVVDLTAEKTGQGTLYYGTRLTYAPQSKLEPRDEGIAVTKRITAQDGKPLSAITPGSLVVVTLEVVVPRESLFVAVEDPLPAGLEAVNPAFLTESDEAARKLDELAGGGPEPWWEGFNHVEMRDDRVVLFADDLMPGIHVHRYLARALTLGEFIQPGTKALQMYAPEVFGRSAESVVKIGR